MDGQPVPDGYATPIRRTTLAPVIKGGLPLAFWPVLLLWGGFFALALKAYPVAAFTLPAWLLARWQSGRDPFWWHIWHAMFFSALARVLVTRNPRRFAPRYWAPR